MKLKNILEIATDNESMRWASYYLDIARDDHRLSGTHFRILPHAIVIFQDTDDDEEPSKYVVNRDEVAPEVWNRFYQLAKEHSHYVQKA